MYKQGLITIIKKTFFGYLNSATAYVIIVPFLLISSFLFLRTALVVGDANLRPFIELLPWFLVVIGPALAMRSFSDHRGKHTLELLFAHPVSEWQIVLGRFLGLWLFYGFMLLGTAVLPLILIVFSQPDLGLMLSQYVGSFLLGGAFLAIGMVVSAYVGSAVGSFLLAAFISFGLMLVGMNFVVLMSTGIMGRVFSEVGIISHLTNFSRGILDFRDVLYFITLTGISLIVTVLKLSARKIAEQPLEKKKLTFLLVLIVCVGVVGNAVMSRLPLRLDLTSAGQYRLSEGTKQLLQELPDRVNVSLYTSNNLPAPMQLTLREVSDRLKDFRRYGQRVHLETIMVTPDDLEAKTKAIEAGIREVQFNQIGAGSFQVQTGFLGMTVRYGDEVETIDFISDAANLEYDLSRIILRLTREEKPSIGLLDITSNSQLRTFETLISDQYDVTYLDEETLEEDLLDHTIVIVIDDGSSEYASMAEQVKQYALNGGSVLLLADGARVDQQLLSVSDSVSAFLDVFSEDFGIRINKDLLYDVQLNESISLGAGQLRYILPYPFWVRSIVNLDAVPWSGVQSNVLLGWPSSITVLDQQPERFSPFLITSQSAGVQSGSYLISPDQIQNLAPPTGEVYQAGVLLSDDQQRIGVIADSDFVGDEFLQNSQENNVFVSNLIDWVAADPLLESIPQRSSGRNVFRFASPLQLQIVHYAGIFTSAVLMSMFGVYWLRRRRHLTKRIY